ncbi:MAG: HAD-IC family P-type ATPase, partial [Acidithiobacillus sp.]
MTINPDPTSAPDIPAVLRQLQSDPQRGLSSPEAARRLAQYGANAIPEKRLSPIRQFLGYFWGPIPWMIEIAAVLSAVVAHWADFAIIMTLLLVNAGVGFWQEHKAGNAIAMLQRKLALRARVLRDGLWQEIAAQDLVPGDTILLKLGNIIPADVLLLSGDYLSVDQSVLTGESLPVDKGRGDSAYSGSIVGKGEMQGVVTATGLQTFFGKTAQLVERAESVSHFRKAVLAIGNFLIVSALVLIAVILFVALAIRHEPMVRTILFALVLTVAAIPVALPAVLSVTMAVGAERLARLKAIVSRLVAIEEMAGMDVLCADKTGTLTQNRLTLGEPVVIGAQDAEELILAAALASERDTGDPIDTAVLGGLPASAPLASYSVLKYQPFDPVSKRSEAEVAAG